MFENLELNGNNYISKDEIIEEVFNEEALKKVTIYDGSVSETKNGLVLIQLKKYGSEWWFILDEKSPADKEREDLLAEIEAQAEAIEELAAIIGGEE